MKYKIQVRNGDNSLVEVISRKIHCKSIGNFVPLFCTYKGKTCLIESDELHIDDPFRCNESEHVNKLFIRPRGKDGKVVSTWKEIQ